MKNMKKLLFLMSFLIGIIPLLASQAQDNAPIYVMTMEGAVAPAYADFFYSTLEQAENAQAQALIIKLNTPGGLLTTTREMVSAIVEAPVPIVFWVTPSGAHAASAGTFLLYASHIAAMDSGTNLGAATPITMGSPLQDQPTEQENAPENSDGEESAPAPADNTASDRKALEDTAAFIRGLAEMRGRNAEWAELAVTEAKSLTSTEALEQNVIDLIATSQDDLLRQIDGRTIALKNGENVTLATDGAPVTYIEPDWKTRILSFLSDPNVAMILMTIGVYGLILEFYNPGTMIPATIGIVCLILGFYAMNILPVNSAGLILLVLGLLFMTAEMFIPSFGIMGIAGVTALLIGGIIMFDTEQMPGLEISPAVLGGLGLAGLLIVGLTVLIVSYAYRKEQTTGTESLFGSEASIVEWAGTEGRVHIQGEIWKARSKAMLNVAPKDKVLVSGIDGLTLVVRELETGSENLLA